MRRSRLERRRLQLLLLTALIGASSGARAATLSTADEALLKRVDAHYNRLHTLRTDFTETYDGLGLHRSESGTMLLSRPGKMRWTYAEPKGKLFVLDTHYAYSYAPGDAQAQRLPAKQLDDLRSPLRLLLGHTELRRELTEIQVRVEPDGGTSISGTPSGAPSSLHVVELRVDANGQIRELGLSEQDGSRTHFLFSNTVEDVPTSSQDFIFAPPLGIPIVNGLPPV